MTGSARDWEEAAALDWDLNLHVELELELQSPHLQTDKTPSHSPTARLRNTPAMFHDLNVPWTNAKEFQRTIAFLDECKRASARPCYLKIDRN